MVEDSKDKKNDINDNEEELNNPQPENGEADCEISPHVLVVEDSRPMRAHMVLTLNRFGFTTCEAEHGLDALRLLRETKEGKKVDLVFLDLLMPHMGGAKFLQSIRSDPDLKDLPVVVVTTMSSKKDIVGCLKLGVSGYIVKPYTTIKLIDELKKVFPKHAAFKRKITDSKNTSDNIDGTVKTKVCYSNVMTHLNKILEKIKSHEGCSEKDCMKNCPLYKDIIAYIEEIKDELE